MGGTPHLLSPFIPAVGWAAGKIGVAAKLWSGCFVINTPVAVGWQYDPLYVGQSGSQASGLPTVDGEASDWNAGWIIAGLGIVATTVLVRDRREAERNKTKKRRLYFANGQFIEDFADDLLGPSPFVVRGGGCSPRLAQRTNLVESQELRDFPI